ncbi:MULTISPECIES: Imm61 family immunity protein [unclassified Mycolicibacterium]|nr:MULTISPECIES: Imm61 family immunity protein [unclassified Mycolicibacterium]
MAQYDTLDHDGETVLRARGRGEYRIQLRPSNRIALLEIDDDGGEHEVLFASDLTVIERFLVGVLGDDVRDDLELDYLPIPWRKTDLAHGFELSGMVRGYRTLSRVGAGPVAASRDETLSLVRLVPLSQFLTITFDELKQSFLHADGAPLLDGQHYSHRHHRRK